MLRNFFDRKADEQLDKQIDAVLGKMQSEGVDSDKYPTMMSFLERLHDLKQRAKPQTVSRDTILIVAGNLLGILVIVAYEQKHVLTSKGINQVMKPKI